MSDAHFTPQPAIGETTVIQDFSKPLVGRTTRWAYMSNYFPLWKDLIRFHLYIYVLIGVAIYFIASAPAISVISLAGAAYFFQLVRQRESRLASARKVMYGH
ncbi:hypothetical protein HY095_02415 [Candidatus Micrarchaeota archaeon]|nr:hypothetical protein [Candidatus Micrarchaeota archaeon]